MAVLLFRDVNMKNKGGQRRKIFGLVDVTLPTIILRLIIVHLHACDMFHNSL